MPLLRPSRSLLLLPLLALALVGCDYSVNSDVGPPGPPGRDGFDGRDGQDAEVLVFTFTFDGGDLAISEDGRSAFAQVEVDDLTLDIVDYGVVLAYADGGLLRAEDAGITWTALPLTLGEQADDDIDVDYTLTYSFSYEVGNFYIDLFASEALTWEDQPALTVRVVLIPGGESGLIGNATAAPDYVTLSETLDLDQARAVTTEARPAYRRALD
ncbi:MAG: hypothetical protein AAFP18_09695 [Bacteroidota bacterium]